MNKEKLPVNSFEESIKDTINSGLKEKLMKKNPLFSIIVPIYNVEKYLVECIESLVNQNFDNFELILVDDGSPDKCGQICDSYKSKNLNVRVIHKVNGGLSDARNAGLREAVGDYVIFIDSDDYICDNNFLLKLANIIKEKNPDLIMYGMKKYYEDKKIYEEKNILSVDTSKSLIHNMIEQNYFKASSCDKVIKRKIINDNKMAFPYGKLSEDIEWCARLLKIINFDNIAVLNENVYVYRQRESSITKTLKEKHVLDIITMIENEKVDDKDSKSMILNSYLAYEYSVVFAVTGFIKVNQTLKKRIKSNSEILKYDICNKVKLVNKLVKFFGLNLAPIVLGIYIKVK